MHGLTEIHAKVGKIDNFEKLCEVLQQMKYFSSYNDLTME